MAGAFGKKDYAKVLELSLWFYEAQKSGKLPKSNRVKWRGDSFLKDCVPGGFFDAGDHLKLLFPLSTSLAFLGISMMEFAAGYGDQLKYGKETLKWGAEFIIKCHVAPTKFIGQIGDPGVDHSYWGRPEDVPASQKRPCYTWDLATQPASDLASAAASALTTAAIVLKPDDPTLAAKALKHAIQLYKAGKAKPGLYSDTYPDVTKVYKSSTFADDMALAAFLLWKATGEAAYLADAKKYQAEITPNSFVSWDSVGPLTAILLEGAGQGDAKIRAHVASFTKDWQSCSSNGFKKTAKGLCIAPLGGWGNLRYSCNAAFAQLVYAKYEKDATKKKAAIAFAKSQVEYAMGSSGRSYITGYGKNPPVKPHHRAASCGDKPKPCDWGSAFENAGPNGQILYGALVGGPAGPSDEYTDDRKNYQTNEVAMDFNAGLTTAVAGLLALV